MNLDEKTKILIKNNLNWLHTVERAEYQILSGRVPITDEDLFEIIEKYENK